jgi:4,5-dihydroxyphthalate decarboxylase
MVDTVTLRAAIANYPHVHALKSGAVQSDQIDWRFEEIANITRAFRRMVRTLDFDLCEIALTTLAQARAFDIPIIGLPIVVMRGFHHASLVCPNRSAITGPKDLRGKRVGVRAWSQTTGVWVRGILRDEYGIDHRNIDWVTAEDAHVAGYVDPPNVRRMKPGQDLASMLIAGDIDAGIALSGLAPDAVRPVISNADQEAAQWFAKAGVYPANHLLCVKTSLTKDHPWLVDAVTALCRSAKHAASEPSIEARFAPIVGNNVLPYGLEANRRSIEMCLRYAAEQGLIPDQMDIAQVVI